MSLRLSAGIDEAGRGCVIGPLVVAIVAATDANRRQFRNWNVRDSKIVPPKQRDELSKRIKDRCWFAFCAAFPAEIDAAVRDRARTLNGLERDLMAGLLRQFRNDHPNHDVSVLVDAPSINALGFRDQLHHASGWDDAQTLRAIHRADETDRTVGAASIIAKAERERLIAELKTELGTDFGSGYSHDERTILHLKTAEKEAVYVRWSWATAARLQP
jgi:ribonuclease HII